MKKFKKGTKLILSFILILAVMIAGTVVYAVDAANQQGTENDGNVKIRQIEQQRAADGKLETFRQYTNIAPAYVTDEAAWTPSDPFNEYLLWDESKIVGAVDKFVSVKNIGNGNAFFRTVFAFECPADVEIGEEIKVNVNSSDYKIEWLNESVTIEGEQYRVMTATYQKILEKGAQASPSLLQVAFSNTMDSKTSARLGNNYQVIVKSQAVQADDADDAETALNEAFGEMDGITISRIFDGTTKTIKNDTTFDETMEMFAEGGIIYLEDDINLTNSASGNTTITTDADVHIYADDDTEIKFEKDILLKGSGRITIHGGSVTANAELCTTDNAELVIDGGEHTLAAFSATGNGSIVVNDGVLNCKATYGRIEGISFAGNGQLIVNGGTINLDRCINMNADRCDAVYVEINGGTINLLQDCDKLFIVRNILDKDRAEGGVLRGSSIKVTGGVFTTTYQLDSDGDANAFVRNEDDPADKNKVLVSNTFDGNPDYNCVVTGGTFYGCWQRSDNTRYVNGIHGNADGLVVENSIAGFVADGYQITGDSTNGYVVSAK